MPHNADSQPQARPGATCPLDMASFEPRDPILFRKAFGITICRAAAVAAAVKTLITAPRKFTVWKSASCLTLAKLLIEVRSSLCGLAGRWQQHGRWGKQLDGPGRLPALEPG